MAKKDRTRPLSDALLDLTTLGRVSLDYTDDQGQVRNLLGPGKPLALIVYVRAAPHRSVHRDTLLDLLWPGLELEAARHALRQTIWSIRRRIADDIVTTQNGTLSVSRRVRVDYEDFLEMVERVELERAVESYGGDFLAGLSSGGGPDFEQWTDRERYRLRLVLRRCVEVLVRQRLFQARLRPAIDLARRACQTDPLAIGVRHLLVEALLSAGDVVNAKLEAEALDAQLRAGGEPLDRADLKLIDVARNARVEVNPTARLGLACEMVGREVQFGEIMKGWTTAQSGRTTHIHVAADAGFGKTRLLRAVHRRLLASGAQAVYLRANSGEHTIPSALIGDLVGQLGTLPGAAGVSPAAAGTLVTLNPALSTRYATAPDLSQGEESVRRRALALAEVFAAITEEAPIAVLVDNLQWCDPTSRLILEAAVSKAGRDRLLVVTAAQRGARGTISLPETVGLELEPIEPKDLETLVSSIADLPDEPWAHAFLRDLWRTTLGCPLLVVETLQLMTDRGCLIEREGRWECRNEQWLRGELERGGALRRRIANLEPSQRWILTLLSVAGCPVDATHIVRAAGPNRHAVLADLAILDRRALSNRAGPAWMTAHDEIAALVMDHAGDDLVRSAHRALGMAIANDGTSDPNQLLRAGRHLVAGGEAWRARSIFRRWVIVTGGMSMNQPDIPALPSVFLGAGAPAPALALFTAVVADLEQAPPSRRHSVRPVTAASLLVAGGILGFAAAKFVGTSTQGPDTPRAAPTDSLVANPSPDTTSIRLITAAGPAPTHPETGRR